MPSKTILSQMFVHRSKEKPQQDTAFFRRAFLVLVFLFLCGFFLSLSLALALSSSVVLYPWTDGGEWWVLSMHIYIKYNAFENVFVALCIPCRCYKFAIHNNVWCVHFIIIRFKPSIPLEFGTDFQRQTKNTHTHTPTPIRMPITSRNMSECWWCWWRH